MVLCLCRNSNPRKISTDNLITSFSGSALPPLILSSTVSPSTFSITRKKLFGFIPLLTRESSSWGYSQATKGTWKQYKIETGKRFVTRISFRDSVDFVGWYISTANKELGISKKDTYSQYLAYHEGLNGFRKKTYKKKPQLLKTASRVEKQAQTYNRQLSKCMGKLDRNKYILF